MPLTFGEYLPLATVLPWLADMIEGVIAANGLTAPQSDRLRGELWALCGAERFDDRTEPVARVA